MASLAELLKRGKKVTPFEQAHFLARLNASLPEDVGGLGLPLENTAMQRADIMFPDIAYHGTNKDISAFDVDAGKYARENTGTWLSSDPRYANTYAGREGGNVIPMRVNPHNFGELDFEGNYWNYAPEDAVLRSKNFDLTADEYGMDRFDTNETARLAKQQGLWGVKFENVKDYGGHMRGVDKMPEEAANNYVVNKPMLMRSKFAAFDPMKRTSSDILASHPIANAIGITGLGKLLSAGQDVNLRQSINDRLNQSADPLGLYSRYGMEAPYSYGDVAQQALGAMPGPVGNAATGLSLLQMLRR